jgi:aldehyde dehydrogenase
MAYHIHEPLGVVGQIIPWNFPILMAAWKLAPAWRGQLRGAEARRIRHRSHPGPDGTDRRPAAPGVLNIVNGYGREAGKPLASSKRIAKIAFTGSTTTGRVIMQAAART